ncbi:MAG: flagellar biosynthesis protein FliQ [Marinomonas sp.]|uniref:flagellar biosynthesis protein FliQ n=1 Tax=unclassified Marinomonas TaxID=196814 RepID=UPI0005FA0E93|nr:MULTISPECIES: flagellar biosynthesis protein FliQ [unclassified Marinomonas]KJZ16336.1 flagellar biosynthesis protein FliQ [Marinomonas sp. S3726]KZM40020.1 flagellar biosynthesis protein FliQ [Marinomonas sp. SBI22]KZM41314.1 flagellar biosynthesis protein FliQ [Marinomonas sp. SBI8L]
MDPQVVLDLYGQAFLLIVIMVGAVMVPSLIVGLIVSVFQAATQINEQTLTFLPRLIVTILVIIYLGPWLLQKLVDFTSQLFIDIPLIIG